MAAMTPAPDSDGALLALKASLTTNHAITFLPDDPPRLGALVVYGLSRSSATPSVTDQLRDQIEVVLPNATGGGARRHSVPARRVPISQALYFLRDLRDDVPGAAAWLAALTLGLGVIARGRLFPAVTAAGWDAWQVGPLDPGDRRLLAELIAAFPPAAHALPLDRSSPLRLRSPESLVLAAWDALADTLPRTAAAGVVAGTTAAVAARGEARDRSPQGMRASFAVVEPVSAVSLRPWLTDEAGGLLGETGVDVALRIELDAPALAADRSRRSTADTGPSDSERPSARAELQLTSRAETSLVVDAADLFRSPAAVISRFGEDAETDLLRALRRGARAWAPLEPLLHERAPTGVDLDDDLLAELLAAVIAAPGVVVEAGFGLDTLVEFRWQATLHG